jgi:class 3 adenylate cyclase
LEGVDVASEQAERKLATILAADVAGHSRLMAADEEGTLARLKSLRRELIDPKIKEYRGRSLKRATGDGGRSCHIDAAGAVVGRACARIPGFRHRTEERAARFQPPGPARRQSAAALALVRHA